jgi:hypothetical protein
MAAIVQVLLGLMLCGLSADATAAGNAGNTMTFANLPQPLGFSEAVAKYFWIAWCESLPRGERSENGRRHDEAAAASEFHLRRCEHHGPRCLNEARVSVDWIPS